MATHKYGFDLAALAAALTARGLPIEYMEGGASPVIYTTRKLTAAEKTALSKVVIGPFSAIVTPDAVTNIPFMIEETL